jgi:hypothetical protein
LPGVGLAGQEGAGDDGGGGGDDAGLTGDAGQGGLVEAIAGAALSLVTATARMTATPRTMPRPVRAVRTQRARMLRRARARGVRNGKALNIAIGCSVWLITPIGVKRERCQLPDGVQFVQPTMSGTIPGTECTTCISA